MVIDRNHSEWQGIIFPGGHVNKGEAFCSSVCREVFEETGLTIVNPVLCGIKYFPTKQGERYVVLMYKTDKFSGQLRSSDEGEVFWTNLTDVNQLNLAKDFSDMLDVMLNNDKSEFFYYLDENSTWQKKIL